MGCLQHGLAVPCSTHLRIPKTGLRSFDQPQLGLFRISGILEPLFGEDRLVSDPAVLLYYVGLFVCNTRREATPYHSTMLRLLKGPRLIVNFIPMFVDIRQKSWRGWGFGLD
jgi:hypothetical protein